MEDEQPQPVRATDHSPWRKPWEEPKGRRSPGTGRKRRLVELHQNQDDVTESQGHRSTARKLSTSGEYAVALPELIELLLVNA